MPHTSTPSAPAATILRRGEPGYPSRLSGLDMAPQQLWSRGRWDEAPMAVAIVGARAASGAGQAQAALLARDLCAAGVSVISGGAMGIDAAAHNGALSAGGRTLVVLGTGVDVTYPQRHAPLFDQIVAQGGCLLSMFPLGTPPKPWHFPARNRIIAALADVVVVIESQLGSGSRITALAGKTLGKAVLALPGSPGTTELLREGAGQLRGSGDVLRLLGLLSSATAGAEEPWNQGLDLLPIVPGEQTRRLRTALDAVPRDLGELSTRAGLPASACAAAIIDLELQGFCTRLTGGRYIALEHAS